MHNAITEVRISMNTEGHSMEMACQNCNVFNDLDHWESEALPDGWTEISCPSCGALHHAKRSRFSGLMINLVEDQG
jgi:ribosomal protein S27E